MNEDRIETRKERKTLEGHTKRKTSKTITREKEKDRSGIHRLRDERMRQEKTWKSIGRRELENEGQDK